MSKIVKIGIGAMFLWILVSYCLAQENTNSSQVTELIVTLLQSPESSDSTKNKLSMNDADFAEFMEQATPDEKQILTTLRCSLQYASTSLSDDSLAYRFKENKVIHDVETLFDKEEFVEALHYLETCSPEEAKKWYQIIAAVGFQSGGYTYGAVGTTWAAERLKTALENIRKVELAERSVPIKLLVANGEIELPNTADAVFDWSKAPKVSIPLLAPVWNKEDIPVLEKLLKDERYIAQRPKINEILEEL